MTTNTTITRAPPFELGSSFHLPEIMTKLPAKHHPNVAAIEEQSAAWVRRHLSFAFSSEQRLSHFLDARCAYFGCVLWPNTRDECMLDLANLCQHLFAFDDAYGDRDGIGRDTSSARKVFEDFFLVMAGNAPRSGHPYAMNFHDLWVNIALPMTDGQRRRYRATVEDWLSACIREIGSRQKGVVFDLDTYMAVRRASVWSTPSFPIIEHGLGIALPEELATSRELEDLHLLCTDCMILINDLFSFHKEALEGDFVNVVPILCIHDNLSLQQAIDHVCALLLDAETQFFAKRDALLTDHQDLHLILNPYVSALGDYIAGLLHWARMTTRYHGPGYVWNGLTSGIVTLEENGMTIRPAKLAEKR